MNETLKTKEKNKIRVFDLFRFKKAFENMINIKAPFDFSYSIIKNLRLIQEALNDFEEAIKPSSQYLEIFQPKVEDLIHKFCKKDDDGNPVTIKKEEGSVTYDFSEEGRVDFEKELFKLENDPINKTLVEERKKQIIDYNKRLEEPIDINLLTFSQDLLKEIKDITPSNINMIFELID